VVKELLPASVAGLAEVDVHQRIVPGLGGLLDQRHSGYLRGSATFFDVALGAGTDDIFPDRIAAHAPWDDVVERQFVGRKSSPAILAAVFVTGKDVSAVEFYVILRQAVIE